MNAPAVLRPPPEEIRLFGFRLNPMTGDEVIDQIAGAVVNHRRLVMANVNLHAMATMYKSPAMAKLLSQSDAQVMIDGMPIIALAKLKGYQLTRAKRTTSLDFYDKMFTLGATRGWRFGYVGADPETLQRGLAILRERVPGLQIDGRHGYFDMADDRPGSRQAEIIDWMNREAHDVVIVGMGMPRQEVWIERVQHRVNTTVFLPTGAYLDYQAGTQRLAPRWMGQMGLEWLYRLAGSPRRLGYRYLVEPLLLMARMALHEHPQTRWLEGEQT